ncbi:MAG: eukaryotic-like serine/threonine-protein kinase [Blastocatellia bacterium]|jgi:serine/threonine protein kinase/Tol biopolymer transport system component|nr:eukaryotic-like serine/threonine-protein kinase [Blastocatellia bacterium]
MADMNRERWQEVDSIFEAALARPASERDAFLDEACAGDPDLRAEVDSLIASEATEDFMNDPAFTDAARVLVQNARHSLTGQTIGSYQILESLGAGGMGEVYLALHLRTNRKVALKLLPAAFMNDGQRVRRFQQEARTVLALNHPNIVTVYDIEQAGDTHLIATEVIEGETLRQRLSRGALDLAEALDVAIQIAGALAAAHEAGVVHRDIKPENVMLRPDGFVKVLDFGLAKLTEREQRETSSELPTRALVRTDAGMVIGTANYMSPEQARGQEVDARTDTFSFGIMFYEMLTGNMPFSGGTKSDVMAAILQNEPPPLARFLPKAPEALEWIVTKTLAKNRDERYQTAKELLTDLKRLKRRSDYQVEAARFGSTTSGDSGFVAPGSDTATNRTAAADPPAATAEATRTLSSAEYVISEIKRHKRGVMFTVAGIAFLVIAAIGIVIGIRYLRPTSLSQATNPFRQTKVAKLTTTGNASQAAISPDGKYVVHVTGGAGKQSLLLRHIATGSDKEIVAANGNDFSWLTFSRDGSYVLYSRVEAGIYPLFQVPVLGGTPQKLIADDVDTRVSFSPDGKRFAFMRGEPQKGETSLILANADGTHEQVLSKYKVSDFSGNWPFPSWAPDGQTIAVAHRTGNDRSTNVVTVRVADGQEKQITSQQWPNILALSWLADAQGLVITAGEPEATYQHQIWFVSYPSGEARKITSDANNYVGLSLTEDSSSLVTVQAEQAPNLWLAPNGDAARAKQITSSRGDGLAGVAFTPDGRIVYTSVAHGSRELWVVNTDGSGQKQLMSDAKAMAGPFVSPDGRYVVFSSARAGAPNIWRINIDGSNPKQLTTGTHDQTPSISPDSRWVFYTATESDKQRLRKVPIDGGESEQLTDYSSGGALVSPDGKQIACAYIDIAKKRWSIGVISIEGGPPIKTFEISPLQARFQWSYDGRAVLYTVTRDGVTNIWSQPIDGSPPKQVTDFKSDQIFRFDWSHDGKRLVLARGPVSSDVVLISNLR